MRVSQVGFSFIFVSVPNLFFFFPRNTISLSISRTWGR